MLRQTMRQRLQAKLKALKDELRRRMHLPVPEQGAWLRRVVAGHMRYYGVPNNSHALCYFRWAVGWLWRCALARRSQKTRLPWKRMRGYLDRWLPPARICHPWPSQRLAFATQGRSRMR